MKVTVCFGLDNCSTAHLDSPAKRKKKNTTDKNFLFWEQKFSSISKQTDWGSYGSGCRVGLGDVPASLKHTNSGSSRELSIGYTSCLETGLLRVSEIPGCDRERIPSCVTYLWVWLSPCRPFPFPWCSSTCAGAALAQESGQCCDELSQG